MCAGHLWDERLQQQAISSGEFPELKKPAISPAQDAFLSIYHAKNYILPYIQRMGVGDLSRYYILDLGCGYGHLVQILTSLGYSCVGVDIRYHRIRQAFSKGSSSAAYIVADAMHLPFRDGCFHMAFTHSVLTYTDVSKSVVEANRVLSKQTRSFLLIVEFNRLNAWVALKSGFGSAMVLSPQSYVRELEMAGFKVEMLRSVDFVPTRVRRMLPSTKFFDAMCDTLDSIFARIWPINQSGGFVVALAATNKSASNSASAAR